MQFAQMLNSNEAMTVRDLNAAFTDPRKISIAYFEASLLVDHIVQTYGDDGLHRLLKAYGEGLETEPALKKALDTDFDQLQAAFDKKLDRDFGSLRRALVAPAKDVDFRKMALDEMRAYAAAHQDSYIAQLMLGSALRKANEPDEAVRALERAAALVPIASGADSPHSQLADIAIEKKDRGRAIAELETLMRADFNNLPAARKLAGLLKEEGTTDSARLKPVYERIAALDPFDADAHTMLGRFALQHNNAAAAVREFRAVVAIGPVDQAAAHTDLAESYMVSGRRGEAKKETLAALEIAPSYERAQSLLLKLSDARP
jgi:tetratricopeptide (TPR) repeat protein